MLKPARQLEPDEVEQLLTREVPARRATLDAEGFPHVTPLWFVWTDGAFYMTSVADRPHLRRVARTRGSVLVLRSKIPSSPTGNAPTARCARWASRNCAWTTARSGPRASSRST
jgi:nitroimidazol reductase NimA-like FMN-containing flavoprotein (pyridoxamine 5'-phosphate oxidase superfamily)